MIRFVYIKIGQWMLPSILQYNQHQFIRIYDEKKNNNKKTNFIYQQHVFTFNDDPIKSVVCFFLNWNM